MTWFLSLNSHSQKKKKFKLHLTSIASDLSDKVKNYGF